MLSRRADLVSCNSLLYGSSGRCLSVLNSSGAVLPNPALATFVTFAPLGSPSRPRIRCHARDTASRPAQPPNAVQRCPYNTEFSCEGGARCSRAAPTSSAATHCCTAHPVGASRFSTRAARYHPTPPLLPLSPSRPSASPSRPRTRCHARDTASRPAQLPIAVQRCPYNTGDKRLSEYN